MLREGSDVFSLEQDTRFELALSAWKADVLTADTNPAYNCEIYGLVEVGTHQCRNRSSHLQPLLFSQPRSAESANPMAFIVVESID